MANIGEELRERATLQSKEENICWDSTLHQVIEEARSHYLLPKAVYLPMGNRK